MAIWTRYSGTMSTTNGYIKYRTKVVLNSQNTANNTSNVTVSVEVWRTNTGYTTRGTGTAYLTIDGTNYSDSIVSTQLFTHNSYTQVNSRTVNISHGADGAKNLGVSARIAHSQFSSSSQSYSTSLNTIPRASSLSAFSFASHMKPSTAVTINYTVDRKSDGFRHQIKLLDGSHEVQVWDNISSNGASTLSLSTASVNSMLNRMSSVTTRALTLRVATRSGHNGGWIGSAVTRNATITVDGSVAPSVGALTLSQTGNSVSSHYLQGKSRITGSFTRSGGYGSTISSSSITVRRKGNNDDVQTINSNSGTIGRAVAHSGTYQAQGMARDSRGRTSYTAWTDFSVTAYSTPRITNFEAVRSSSAETTIVVTRNGTHTSLGRTNSARMLIQKRTGTGAWTTVQDISDPSGIWSGSVNSTENSVTSSHDFRATLTDAFGESATAMVTVSTQRVVLDIHKNEGVGIGKIHERGVLDVDGEVYLNGKVMALGGLGFEDTRNVDEKPQGIPARAFSFAFKRADIINNPPERANVTYAHLLNIAGWSNSEPSGGYPMQMSIGSEGISLRQGTGPTSWGPWSSLVYTSRGSNSNGNWVRFGDGTQICWHRWTSNNTTSHSDGNGMWRSGHISKTHAQAFTSIPSVSWSALGDWRTWIGPDSVSTTGCNGVMWRAGGAMSSTQDVDYIAIGRWK